MALWSWLLTALLYRKEPRAPRRNYSKAESEKTFQELGMFLVPESKHVFEESGKCVNQETNLERCEHQEDRGDCNSHTGTEMSGGGRNPLAGEGCLHTPEGSSAPVASRPSSRQSPFHLPGEHVGIYLWRPTFIYLEISLLPGTQDESGVCSHHVSSISCHARQ